MYVHRYSLINIKNSDKMEIKEITELISRLLDSKLEPIKNDIAAMKTDLSAVRIHVDAINNRLYKLEERVANLDSKLDKICMPA